MRRRYWLIVVFSIVLLTFEGIDFLQRAARVRADNAIYEDGVRSEILGANYGSRTFCLGFPHGDPPADMLRRLAQIRDVLPMSDPRCKDPKWIANRGYAVLMEAPTCTDEGCGVKELQYEVDTGAVEGVEKYTCIFAQRDGDYVLVGCKGGGLG